MPKSTLPRDSVLDALPELSSGLFAKAHDLSVTADQIVFLAGDAGDGIYRIEDGLLKVSVSAPGGGERILAILGSGSIVGELSMIDGAPRSASVSALRNSKLRFVSRAAFEAFGQETTELYRHVMILLARRLRDTNGALAATSFLSLQGRVARALLNLAEGSAVTSAAGVLSCGRRLRKATSLQWPALLGKMSAASSRSGWTVH